MLWLLNFLLASLVFSAPPSVDKITFEGLIMPLSEERLRNSIPFKSGDPWEPGKLPLAREMILSSLEANGYLDSVVDSSFELKKSSADVTFKLYPGAQYHFGETEVKGLEKITPAALIRELGFKPGEPFNRQKLLEGQSRLYNLGLFEDITFRTSTTTFRSVNIEVFARERPLQWIKGGIGYGSVERQRLTLVYTHQNFLRRAYKLELLGTLSAIWLEYRADFTNRFFLGSRTEQHTDISWRHEDREGYDMERSQGNLGLGRQLPMRFQGSARYRLERIIVFNLDPEISAATPEQSKPRAVLLGLNRDVTNDYFFPSKGSRLNLSLDTFGRLLGGNIHFQRVSWESSLYQLLFNPLVAAFSLRAGAERPLKPSTEVPIFEKFFTGGANSVRGYPERGVGPKDAQGSPLGGRWLLGGSFELRFPLFWRLGAALFTDGGQVAPRAHQVDFSKWKTSAGGGLRFRSPVGPFRLDVGYKLNPSLADRDLWRVHLSLGEAF